MSMVKRLDKSFQYIKFGRKIVVSKLIFYSAFKRNLNGLMPLLFETLGVMWMYHDPRSVYLLVDLD